MFLVLFLVWKFLILIDYFYKKYVFKFLYRKLVLILVKIFSLEEVIIFLWVLFVKI